MKVRQVSKAGLHLLVTILVLMLTVLFVSCEGPAGPAGIDRPAPGLRALLAGGLPTPGRARTARRRPPQRRRRNPRAGQRRPLGHTRQGVPLFLTPNS